ncbi:unnamed protein product [Aspergillus oryzae var. brunneus]|uniref:Unnamed protein product n=1 Tax=Aspergillus oryzae var. brunneus TaxID=332754 RepID=A0ABQ6KPB9_ASPOZ|nr:unnamed protein product [Aspergillus oryzae var. brunneus]
MELYISSGMILIKDPEDGSLDRVAQGDSSKAMRVSPIKMKPIYPRFWKVVQQQVGNSGVREVIRDDGV